ncbi:methyltransferase [Pseudomonas fluorescens]|uniref:Methyltransferase domain-containing protein n=1 Tax=Pseudomonas fluorescens TaxID=294 RepID=A0A7Z6QKZ6_PSEFL|nr:methyltransferase [Pseudomonas fluorescens]RDS86990.1 methyltransferase domain-containing protein [Pseudomonas fluorescens]
MLGLIDHGSAGNFHVENNCKKCLDEPYKIYFGLGQSVSLTQAPDVFKVSRAGIRLGNYLVQSLNPKNLNSSFLDIGTGSGVLALLMRKLGGNDITATDICEKSITQAKINEHLNFKQPTISFFVSDLFDGLSEQRFQTIVFNPPGWRTPSRSLIQRLETQGRTGQLPIHSMFYGDEVISRFLDELPKYLNPTGVAIVGLNSLVGIRDILERYNQKYSNAPPLTYKLIERHTLPLIHYSTHWKALEKHLKLEFEKWQALDLATYSTDKNGDIYWSYEIIEFSHHQK